MLIAVWFLFSFTDARRLPDIYWNSTNQIFDISNTEHVMSVKLLDRVTIICPQPSSFLPYEYSKLYAVSREGYDSCELRNERLIGVCHSADKYSSISIVFRDFSPLPGALEFRPGRSYYIISTSNGDEQGIDRRSGGLCEAKHMKVKFEVQSEKGDPPDDYMEPASVQFKNQARTSSEMSTPVLYIIHTSEASAETYPGPDEDGRSSVASPGWLFIALMVTLCSIFPRHLY